MLQRLVLQEKDVHAPENDFHSPAAEAVGDLVAAKGRAGHEGNPDEVRVDGVKMDLLDVFIEDADVEPVIGMGGKDGQIQLGDGGLGPPPGDESVFVGGRVNENKLGILHFDHRSAGR